ncbi:hypothetical protein HOL21_04820 [Candidatus Woesearchaeota archaeon]|jgi:hypothetical protein|nr:hypothetical protein [Candidatus Woesearchaeota archaeon]MBT5397509.1 hypothetical protein [Candidatus Woesearchaeota archaeon]MBT5924142.1 hypothetical protein [Candidatus Woesearchaeota archaeon]MBT6367918.1 hypothetical protein [Candidatus Woesearchaeota archaeon]MBT7763142.1 hypothetical protein [Candidatus Woesearchaeota archaeon]
MAEVTSGFSQKLNAFNTKINAFFSFIGTKLKNYPKLSIGEKISYPSIALGVILIITSIILFVV